MILAEHICILKYQDICKFDTSDEKEEPLWLRGSVVDKSLFIYAWAWVMQKLNRGYLLYDFVTYMILV